MFEKEKRFSFKQGLPKKVITSPYFTLRFGLAKGEMGTNAVVVSKKVSKKAVIRNRIKRKVVSSLKETQDEKLDKYDLVFYIKPQIIEAHEQQVDLAIQESIRKI